MRDSLHLFILLILVVVIMGCSSGGDISTPLADERSTTDSGHSIIGFWRMTADPINGTLEVFAMRDAAMHLNALVFLEPPALLNLTLDYVEFIGDSEIIADIGLRHPFLGLTEFSGFDVCGILISNGTGSFGETGLTYAVDGDTRLLNADAYSRWWNPSEFPSDGSMFSYQDGLLGAPDSIANFNCRLSGYKYYSDELTGIDDDVLTCTPSARGLFSAGQKNVRRFHIALGAEGLTFNYAVDANWVFPTGSPPFSAPDDFGPDANRPEAWGLSVTELDNSLFNDGAISGGDLSLEINIYDHFGADLNTVRVQSPGNFTAQITDVAIGGGVGYSTYQVDIIDATPAEGSIPLYFVIESETIGYGGILPGEPVSAYFMGSADVAANPPGCYVHVDDDNTGGPWDGSSGNPYQYLQDAIYNVSDDCTILVHPGTYDESGSVNISGLSNVTIEGMSLPVITEEIVISGTCPNLVIDGLEILADNPATAAFDITADDVTIQNCVVTPTTTAYFNSAVRCVGTSNLTISGNTFDEFNSPVGLGMKLMDLSGLTNATITLNTCIDFNSFTDGAVNTTVSFIHLVNSTGCEISKNKFGVYDRTAVAGWGHYVHGYYIRVDGGSSNIIRNNLLYDLHIENVNYPNSYNYVFRLLGCPDIEVYNNTIDTIGPTKTVDDSGGTYGIIDFGGCSGITLYNNIITNLYHYRGAVGIYEYSGGTPRYNDVWGLTNVIGSSQRYIPAGSEGEGDLNADPMFNAPSTGDYTLQSGSPCIDAGRIGGMPSGNPTDMGCYGGSDPMP